VQGSFPQLSRADNLKTLVAVQDAINGVIENQHKLMEKMQEILSNQLRAEKGLEALKASVHRVSDAFDDWRRKTESEGNMNACNE
jgi:predicted  nucleic acid-binding Zn-ribbon protein